MELAFGLLGPLEIREDGRVVPPPVGNQRRILALLLLDGGVVSRARLTAELWGRVSPKSAPANLRTYLSGVRAWLGDRADLVRDGTGWVLTAPDHVRSSVDTNAFRVALTEGRRAARAGDLAGAAGQLQGALGHWRGAALQGVPQGALLAAQSAVLTAERLAATEEYAEALLGLGEYEPTRAMLHAFLGEHPSRERAWGQLMVACYRGGDLAGALDAYRAARTALVTGYGVEPSAELAALHRAILRRELPSDVFRPTRYPADRLPYRYPLRPPARQTHRRGVVAAPANQG